MQEPKTDKDEEYSTKVNNLLNNPPTPGSGGGGSGLPPALAGLSEQLGKSAWYLQNAWLARCKDLCMKISDNSQQYKLRKHRQITSNIFHRIFVTKQGTAYL